MAEKKTNAMRILEQKHIEFTTHHYPCPDGALDGMTVASLIGVTPAKVFKTLVTRGTSQAYYVFVVPVTGGLDVKAAARAVGEKSIELIRQVELLPLTGYVHGGCSPIGMKKLFQTVVDQSAEALETMVVSAGRIGMQAELAPQVLCALTRGKFAPVLGEA